jgi:RNA polymerase sigma-70 factor (ECF subfamily)
MTPEQSADNSAQITSAHNDYEKRLSLYAFSKVHDRALSDDLVQNTFIKTWTYLVKGGKVATMKAFLFHILKNLIVDEYRKHKTTSLDALLEKGIEPGDDSTERLMNVFDGKAIVLLIQRLPEKYREVVHMRYVQDFSLKEIASITGQSKNAIAVQVHRGLAKLKELYASHA